MPRNVMFWTLSVVLTVTLAACGPNKAEIKKREVATRDLGKQYYLGGDYTTALKYLLEAEELNKNDHILQYYLGLAYFAKGSADEAIRHFKTALRLKPDYASAKNSLGVVYLSLEEWDKAIAVFKELEGEILYATPHYPLANLGYAYYRKKDYKQAEIYYQKALKLEPNHPPALLGLGRTYLALGRVPEAVAALSGAIDLYPEMVDAHYELGRAYMMLRDYRKAKAAFQMTVRLAPASTQAAEARTILEKLKNVK
jgi:type IV pilus assembly protein PilF